MNKRQFLTTLFSGLFSTSVKADIFFTPSEDDKYFRNLCDLIGENYKNKVLDPWPHERFANKIGNKIMDRLASDTTAVRQNDTWKRTVLNTIGHSYYIDLIHFQEKRYDIINRCINYYIDKFILSFIDYNVAAYKFRGNYNDDFAYQKGKLGMIGFYEVLKPYEVIVW